MTTLNRRSLAGALAAFAMAPVAVPVVMALEPDAVLINACAEFKRLQLLWDAAGDGNPQFNTPEYEAVDAERDRIGELQDDALKVILKHFLTTLAGITSSATPR